MPNSRPKVLWGGKVKILGGIQIFQSKLPKPFLYQIQARNCLYAHPFGNCEILEVFVRNLQAHYLLF
jgi:hypothetical protein